MRGGMAVELRPSLVARGQKEKREVDHIPRCFVSLLPRPPVSARFALALPTPALRRCTPFHPALSPSARPIGRPTRARTTMAAATGDTKNKAPAALAKRHRFVLVSDLDWTMVRGGGGGVGVGGCVDGLHDGVRRVRGGGGEGAGDGARERKKTKT